MKDFVENTMPYLAQYHQRSNSESGFAADKKMLGWNIAQRRDDRIDGALFCTGVWDFDLFPSFFSSPFLGFSLARSFSFCAYDS